MAESGLDDETKSYGQLFFFLYRLLDRPQECARELQFCHPFFRFSLSSGSTLSGKSLGAPTSPIPRVLFPSHLSCEPHSICQLWPPLQLLVKRVCYILFLLSKINRLHSIFSGENRLPGQRRCPLRSTLSADGLIVLQVPQDLEGKQDRKRPVKGYSRGGCIAT